MTNPSRPAFPAVVADATFAVVPTWVLDGAPSRAVHLYALLRRYTDVDGLAWPSRATLASRLGCSTDTVDRAVAALERIGALTVERRFGADGAPTSNLYVLHAVPQPVGNPVDDEGGVAAPVRLGSRTVAEGVAAPVRTEREPLNESQRTDPPYPPAAAGGSCPTHGNNPAPRCRGCGTTPRQQRAAAEAESRRRPPWCGSCDERTRLSSVGDAGLRRCPTCHPLEV